MGEKLNLQVRAGDIVAREMANVAHSQRADFLRFMLAHVAAGLLVIESPEEAAEAIYRMADAVVYRARRP